jgi:hypothetical protein
MLGRVPYCAALFPRGEKYAAKANVNRVACCEIGLMSGICSISSRRGRPCPLKERSRAWSFVSSSDGAHIDFLHPQLGGACRGSRSPPPISQRYGILDATKLNPAGMNHSSQEPRRPTRWRTHKRAELASEIMGIGRQLRSSIRRPRARLCLPNLWDVVADRRPFARCRMRLEIVSRGGGHYATKSQAQSNRGVLPIGASTDDYEAELCVDPP